MIRPGELSQCMSMTEVAESVRKTRVTVWNWITKGLTVNGRVVKLAAQKIGAQYVVTPEALSAFVEACSSELRNHQRPEAPGRRAKRLREGKERAAQLLKGQS
jgi:hypothetical protein